MDERDELIFTQISTIAATTGRFVAGILMADITRADQLSFADRLIDCAATIRERASHTPLKTVERGTGNDSNGHASVNGADERRDQPAAGHG